MSETNEERLERIKSGLITGNDIPFVVEGFKKLSNMSLEMQGGALAHKMIVGYVKELEKENKRLREALGYYADVENYVIHEGTNKEIEYWFHVHFDEGDKARQALEGKGNE